MMVGNIVRLRGCEYFGAEKVPQPPQDAAINNYLSKLRLAASLIESAGRGLGPQVGQVASEALVELSVELGMIEQSLIEAIRKAKAPRPGGDRL